MRVCPFPAGTKPQEWSATSTEISMGSKKHFTITQDFEVLTEDAGLEKIQPAWGRCPRAGKVFVKPVTVLRTEVPAGTPESRVKVRVGCPQRRRLCFPEPGYPSKSPVRRPRPNFQSKVSVLDSGVSLGAHKSQVLHSHHFEKNDAVLPQQTLRDGARLRDPTPVGAQLCGQREQNQAKRFGNKRALCAKGRRRL